MASENLGGSRRGAIAPLIVSIGVLVGGIFALGKYVVQTGISPLSVFGWQMLGAGLLLVLGIALLAPGRLTSLFSRPVAVYCVINGLIGVSGPQILSYFALQRLPAGLFMMFLTLSPLFTFLLSSLVSRQLLPLHRLLGILIGLAGVTLATASGPTELSVGWQWLVAALTAPLLLAVTNVYRERAMPNGADALVLATGTLLFQALLFVPLVVMQTDSYLPFQDMGAPDRAVAALALATALSYVLTFELYKRTDGVGFSQVGYFVTLSGIAAGALFFGEAFTAVFALSVLLLFLGMAVTNSHLPLRRLFRGYHIR